MSLFWTSPAWSWPLLLVTAVGALALTARFYDQSRPHPWRGLRQALVVLRSTALLLLVLAVAGPLWTRLLTRDVPSQLVMVLEDSASMALDDGGKNTTRWQASLDLADGIVTELQDRGVSVQARWLRGNGLASVQAFERDDALIAPPHAHGTSLEGLLGQTTRQLVSVPVGAVLLLADGNETLPAHGKSQAGRNPLFVVGFGDAWGGDDRRIEDLRYPDTAFADDLITIEATVVDRLSGVDVGSEAVVKLVEAGKILQEQRIELLAGAAAVSLSFQLENEGLHELELTVSPLDNERFLSNNKLTLGVDVRKARSRILILAPRPGWDVRFLRQAADREARLASEVVHNTGRGLAFADSLTPFGMPDWSTYDALILVGWEHLPPNLDYSLLGEAVSAGLGLLVLPEPPASIVSRVPAPEEGLESLLPVTLAGSRWAWGDHFVFPDSLANEHPVMAGVLTPGAHTMGTDLPPLPGMLESAIKMGGKVLLAGGPRGGGISRSLPLLSVQTLGQGRTAFWSGSRMWELAFWPGKSGRETSSEEVDAVDRLIRNLLVWLADGNDESGLGFVGRQSFFQEGERLGLGAHWRDMRGHPVTDGRLSLKVSWVAPAGQGDEDAPFGDNDHRSQEFSSSGFDPTLEAYPFDLPALPPGHYRLTLHGEGETEVRGDTRDIVITEHSVEQMQVRQDARRLAQLADRLGCRYLDSHETGSREKLLEELLALDWKGAVLENRRQWHPTSGWPFLVVVVILLGCEWFLRRRNGLL